MEKIKFKAVIDSEYFNNPPHLRISIGEDVLVDFPVTEETVIEKDLIVEDDKAYKLNFTLHDKSKYDTVVEDGNIVKDTVIKVKQVELDNVDITSMLPINKDNFYYIHNGSSEKNIFYDTMGVNGTSTLEFTTPFYVWLLENL
jgi:hypothetical protein